MRFTSATLLILALLGGTVRADEVQLVGTIISSSAGTMSNAFDGDVTTAWSANQNDWIGVDLGSGNTATLTSWGFAPQASSGGNLGKEDYMVGAVLESDTSTNFPSPAILDTVPAFPFYPRYSIWQRSAGINSTGRCFRVVSTASFAGIAEVRFFAFAAGVTNAKPIPPTISPWGGHYLTNQVPVTLACRTAGASIYYTTNGTNPTTNSTLYSVPFLLPIGGGATELRAVAFKANLVVQSSEIATNCFFSPWGFQPADDLRGDTGVLIEAHSGKIFDNRLVDGLYYWYGFSANNAENQPDLAGNIRMGTMLYSSADCLNWFRIGQICTNATWTYLERPFIIRQPYTGKYVLWGHGRNLASTAGYAVATSTNIIYPFGFISTNTLPWGTVPGDMTLFQEGASAYLVGVSNSPASGIYIVQLANDYTTTIGNPVNIVTGNREAPAMFKVGSTYFVIHSTGNYYDFTADNDEQFQYCTNANPLGSWFSGGHLFTTNPTNSPGFILNGQSTYVFQPPWSSGNYVYMSDQWHNGNHNGNDPKTLYDSRYVWLPLQASGITLTITNTASLQWNMGLASNSFTATTSETASLNGPSKALTLVSPLIAWWQQANSVTNNSHVIAGNTDAILSIADSANATNILWASGTQEIWRSGTNGAPGFVEFGSAGSLCSSNTSVPQPFTYQYVIHFSAAAQPGFQFLQDYGSGAAAEFRAYMDGSGTGKAKCDSAGAAILGPTSAIADGWHMITIEGNSVSSAIYIDNNATPIAGPADAGANGLNGFRVGNRLANDLGWADFWGEGLVYGFALSTAQIANNYTWEKANHWSFLP